LTMAAESFRDFDFEWLDLVQPTGLVVAKTVLKNLGLVAERQTQVQSSEMAQQLRANGELPALRDPWAFVTSILGWEPDLVAGLPGGPPVPGELIVRLPEHDTTLAPTWAVRELGPEGPRYQLLVLVENGVELDKRGALGGWEATPHQRFERLLRETEVGAGLIIADRELRVVYAPKGETSGWLSFPIADLATVAGRPLLAGLKLLLDRTRLLPTGGKLVCRPCFARAAWSRPPSRPHWPSRSSARCTSCCGVSTPLILRSYASLRPTSHMISTRAC
jgi:hypothetical protein